jgi:transposase-like protein
MGKKGTKRRVYTAEFKTEAVALVEKKEKPGEPDSHKSITKPLAFLTTSTSMISG